MAAETNSAIQLGDAALSVVDACYRGDLLVALLSDGSMRCFARNRTGEFVRASQAQLDGVSLPSDSYSRTVISDGGGHDLVPATAIALHPFIPYLTVIGFRDGSFLLWDPFQETLDAQETFHSAEVTKIRWLVGGRLLATCDASGQVLICAFDLLTRTLTALTRTRRAGTVVSIVERTASSNAIIRGSYQGQKDPSCFLGKDHVELLIAWSKGEICGLTDGGTIRTLFAMSGLDPDAALAKMYYWDACDTVCGLMQSGELCVFSFESLSPGAKKTPPSKARIEFDSTCGVVQLPCASIGYVSSLGNQLRILNVLTQASASLDLDDYLDKFSGVGSSLCYVDNVGIVVPIRGQDSYAVVALRPSEDSQGSRVYEVAPHSFSPSYLRLELPASPGEAQGASDERGEAPLPMTGLRPILAHYYPAVTGSDSLMAFPARSPCSPGESTTSLVLLASKGNQGGSGTLRAVYYSDVPAVATSFCSNTSSAIFAQAIAGDSLSDQKFLSGAFTAARDSFITVSRDSLTSFTATLNGPGCVPYSTTATVPGVIEKLCSVVDFNSSSSDGSLRGFVMAYGQGNFYVYEVAYRATPSLVASFAVQGALVYDAAMFGKYLIVAQKGISSSPDKSTEAGLSAAPTPSLIEVVKYSHNGTRTATLEIASESPSTNTPVDYISRLCVVNNNLFLVDNNGILYYTDIKGFSRYIEVTRLTDLLFQAEAEAPEELLLAAAREESEVQQGQSGSRPPTAARAAAASAASASAALDFNQAMNINQGVATKSSFSRRDCLAKTLPGVYDRDAVGVLSLQGTVTLDSSSICELVMTFEGLNRFSRAKESLGFALCISLNCQELAQLLSAPTASGSAAKTSLPTSPTNTGLGHPQSGPPETPEDNAPKTAGSLALVSTRVLDFCPFVLSGAMIDSFGNLLACLVMAEDTILTYGGLPHLIALKTGLRSHYQLTEELMLLAAEKFTVEAQEESDEESVDGSEKDPAAPAGSQADSEAGEGLEAAIQSRENRAQLAALTKLLRVPITQADRLRASALHPGSAGLSRRNLSLTVQGLFSPNLIPKAEVRFLPGQAYALGLVSPCVLAARAGEPPSSNSGGESGIAENQIVSFLPIHSLSAIMSVAQAGGLSQAASSTHALNKFVISIANNRLDEAYSHVASSDNLEIWRSLSALCVRNNYPELLKTCVSHLKSPIISLLMRSMSQGHGSKLAAPGIMGTSSGVSAGGQGSGDGGSQQVQHSPNALLLASASTGLRTASDSELAAVISAALADMQAGLDAVQDFPIIRTHLLRDAGLAHVALKESTTRAGFAGVSRKASVYSFGNRLYHVGDTRSANYCYNEVLGSVSDITSREGMNVSPHQVLTASEAVTSIRAEFRQKGPEACAALAKKSDDRVSLYTAALLLERESERELYRRAREDRRQRRAIDAQEFDPLRESARLFFLAKAYAHALQVALRCDDSDLIYNIGCADVDRSLILQAAGYFAASFKTLYLELEEAGRDAPDFEARQVQIQDVIDRALALYRSAGFGAQAVELCLTSGRLKQLASLISEITSEHSAPPAMELDDEDGGAKKEPPLEPPHEHKIGAGATLTLSPALLTKAGTALLAADKNAYTLDDYNLCLRTGIAALAKAGAYEEATNAILEGKIEITAQIAKLLTPADLSTTENRRTATNIGKLLFKAGLYSDAATQFLAVGEHMLVLNALTRSGNTAKVVLFARKSRDRKIFIAAANYLQTQNWRDNPKFLQALIAFYTKADAPEHLATFYAHVCREEIEEYHDYEKARDAIKTSLEWLKAAVEKYGGKGRRKTETGEDAGSESEDEAQRSDRMEKLAWLVQRKQEYEENARLIVRFLHFREIARTSTNYDDSEAAVKGEAKKLLQSIKEVEGCYCKEGDVLAVMVTFHDSRGQRANAIRILKEMVKRNENPARFVDKSIYDAYAKEAGLVADDAGDEVAIEL